jgi:hypothetical protein
LPDGNIDALRLGMHYGLNKRTSTESVRSTTTAVSLHPPLTSVLRSQYLPLGTSPLCPTLPGSRVLQTLEPLGLIDATPQLVGHSIREERHAG